MYQIQILNIIKYLLAPSNVWGYKSNSPDWWVFANPMFDELAFALYELTHGGLVVMDNFKRTS